MVRLAVELGKVALEVRAYVPHDLLQSRDMPAGEHGMPVFGHENQVGMKNEDTAPASANVHAFSHETNDNYHVRLRYSYRLYPNRGQRAALARAFGCARMVYNDALAYRQAAHEAGRKYPSDGEMSRRLTASKAGYGG